MRFHLFGLHFTYTPLKQVPRPLLTYRFHAASVTGSRGVAWEAIWDVRVAHLQAHFLDRCVDLQHWTGHQCLGDENG